MGAGDQSDGERLAKRPKWRCVSCGSKRPVAARAGRAIDGFPLMAQCVEYGHWNTPPKEWAKEESPPRPATDRPEVTVTNVPVSLPKVYLVTMGDVPVVIELSEAEMFSETVWIDGLGREHDNPFGSGEPLTPRTTTIFKFANKGYNLTAYAQPSVTVPVLRDRGNELEAETPSWEKEEIDERFSGEGGNRTGESSGSARAGDAAGSSSRAAEVRSVSNQVDAPEAPQPSSLVASGRGWTAGGVAQHPVSALDTLRRLADALELAERDCAAKSRIISNQTKSYNAVASRLKTAEERAKAMTEAALDHRETATRWGARAHETEAERDALRAIVIAAREHLGGYIMQTGQDGGTPDAEVVLADDRLGSVVGNEVTR